MVGERRLPLRAAAAASDTHGARLRRHPQNASVDAYNREANMDDSPARSYDTQPASSRLHPTTNTHARFDALATFHARTAPRRRRAAAGRLDSARMR